MRKLKFTEFILYVPSRLYSYLGTESVLEPKFDPKNHSLSWLVKSPSIGSRLGQILGLKPHFNLIITMLGHVGIRNEDTGSVLK